MPGLDSPGNESFGREPRLSRSEFTWRALIVIVLLALGALLWYTAEVFLIAFAGILLAVFLEFLATKLSDLLKIRRGWAFAIVAVGLSGLLFLAAWEVFPRVGNQISQLIQSLPAAFERLTAFLQARKWGRTVFNYLPSMLASTNIAGRITAIATNIFEGLAGVVVIAVMALYLGGTPSLYERGLLRLFPARHRDRVRVVLGEVAYTMRWWVLGQLIPAVVLGVATAIGLWLLQINLAFTLALFTGFMIFIPYIGSIIALIVTLLVTLIQGPEKLLYVTLFFIGVHIAEGYLLTPLVQRRAVYLPPALTIISQVLLGLLFGFFGLALATPLTAVALVLVRMLYLHEAPQNHH